jgi:hypothetical protein
MESGLYNRKVKISLLPGKGFFSFFISFPLMKRNEAKKNQASRKLLHTRPNAASFSGNPSALFAMVMFS